MCRSWNRRTDECLIIMKSHDPSLSTELAGWPEGGRDAVLTLLQERYVPSLENADIPGLLSDSRLGRLAMVSSFGAESVALLHYIKGLRPNVPVIFLDTGKHFPETLAYRDVLTERLDLDLVVARPDQRIVADDDPTGQLHSRDPDACCKLRKILPLQDALASFDSWISGRKRYQGATRAALPIIERDGRMIKVNPLALWSQEDLAAYLDHHELPRHPLESQGFSSIGCAPCTRTVRPGEDARAGRWPQVPDKTECGIHLGPGGNFSRALKGPQKGTSS